MGNFGVVFLVVAVLVLVVGGLLFGLAVARMANRPRPALPATPYSPRCELGQSKTRTTTVPT
jgi:hypothetical protein